MAYPLPYAPRIPPSIPSDHPNDYSYAELRDVRATLDAVLFMLPQPATALPARPQVGMIRRAMSPWRPVSGQTTDRWVIFNGSTWAYLD